MYANGQVPLSVLVHVAANIWLPPGTLARWNWAVQQAKAKYGVTLRITGQHSSAWNTWNGYRPFSAQILYRNAYGIMAAYPGTSSHGGTYRGKEMFAIDVDNWAELGWARFAAIMRLAGLTVDFVSPQELWHVGDMNNVWAIPAFASGGSGSAINPGTPSKPAPETKREDIMANIPPMATVNGKDIFMLNPDGRTKRLVGPLQMAVYKSIAAKLKVDINDYIAEGVKLSDIPNG